MIRSIFVTLVVVVFLPMSAHASLDSLIVREPRSYGRLTIFPIELRDDVPHTYVTLERALATGRAVIHENNSQKLWIENRSDTDLFIESSAILKGGQQDRMVASDMVVAGHDTSRDLNVYCVEKGRSFKRGAEPIETFSASHEMAPMHHMRVIAQHELTGMLLTPHLGGRTAPDPDQLKLLEALGTMPQFESIGSDAVQESIWHDVAQTQTALSNNLKDSVTRNPSPTSLQLALESKSLDVPRNSYEKHFGDLASNIEHSVGAIYALDGKIVGGDMYGSHEMFTSAWHKHLRAWATEAIALAPTNGANPDLTRDNVLDFLTASTPGKRAKKQVNDRTLTEATESQFAFIFTTRDSRFPDAVIHRAWVVKSPL